VIKLPHLGTAEYPSTGRWMLDAGYRVPSGEYRYCVTVTALQRSYAEPKSGDPRRDRSADRRGGDQWSAYDHHTITTITRSRL